MRVIPLRVCENLYAKYVAYDVSECAEMLHTSKSSVYRMIEKGSLEREPECKSKIHIKKRSLDAYQAFWNLR